MIVGLVGLPFSWSLLHPGFVTMSVGIKHFCHRGLSPLSYIYMQFYDCIGIKMHIARLVFFLLVLKEIHSFSWPLKSIMGLRHCACCIWWQMGSGSKCLLLLQLSCPNLNEETGRSSDEQACLLRQETKSIPRSPSWLLLPLLISGSRGQPGKARP